jgi:hypothetical protein
VQFQSVEELERYFSSHPDAPVWACLVEMSRYPGFFTEVVLRRGPGGVRIGIEHRSCVLDAFGDATSVSVTYEVDSLAEALAWLQRRFLHNVTDCRTRPHRMPPDHSIADGGIRRHRAAWRRLREDFRKGKLTDKQL